MMRTLSAMTSLVLAGAMITASPSFAASPSGGGGGGGGGGSHSGGGGGGGGGSHGGGGGGGGFHAGGVGGFHAGGASARVAGDGGARSSGAAGWRPLARGAAYAVAARDAKATGTDDHHHHHGRDLARNNTQYSRGEEAQISFERCPPPDVHSFAGRVYCGGPAKTGAGRRG